MAMAATLFLSKFIPFISFSKPSPAIDAGSSNLQILPKTQPAPLVATWNPNTLSSTAATAVSAVVNPSLAHCNILFFKSAYNVQVIVGENEPDEKLLGRFRRDVLRAGVIQECKRRRFFENKQAKKKRKARDAAKRNRKRWFKRPLLNAQEQPEQKIPRENSDEEDDNWDFHQVDLPYCS